MLSGKSGIANMKSNGCSPMIKSKLIYMNMNSLIPFLLIFLINSFAVNGQSSFQKHELAKPFTRAAGLCLTDLDGDSDLDVVVGSGTQGLCWYANDGTKAVGWTRYTIDSGLKGSLSVIASDIDQDGRSDLVTGSWDDDQVIWYRNNNDLTFTKMVIDNNLGNPHEFLVIDVDKDGLKDVLAAAMKTGDIAYYKNIDGGNAWVKQIISNQFTGARSVSAGDIDGDGDIDLAGAAFDSNEVVIWKNSGGNPVNWAKSTLSNAFNGAHFVELADINKDGRIDLLVAGYYANSVVWWENNGSEVSSWVMHSVDAQLTRALVSRAVDLDQDGDLDIIATGSTSNCVVWYENTNGNGMVWKKSVVDGAITSPWQVLAGDIDNDMDIDLVAGSDKGHEVRWYSNQPSGRFSSVIHLPGQEIPCGISLPVDYNTLGQCELLVGFHGGGHPTMYSVFRDCLIPVSESRNTIVVTPDIKLAASPDFSFPEPSIIEDVLRYLIKRLPVDTTKIYLIGAGCQGKEILKTCADKTVIKKGAIAINPMIPPIQSSDWAHPKWPVAIFASISNPDFSNILRLESIFKDGKVPAKLITYDGSPDAFLLDELAEYALAGMMFIDTCNLASSVEKGLPVLGLDPKVRLQQSPGGNCLILTGCLGKLVSIDLFDLAGRSRSTLFSGRITSEPFEINLPVAENNRIGSVGFIRLTGTRINQTIKTIL
jgi:hypothetical protein